MANDDTITMLVVEPEESLPGKQMMPGARRAILSTVEIPITALRSSLQKLVKDINELVQDLPDDGAATLDQISVALQATSIGGLQWIASIGGYVQGTMTVTFKFPHLDARKQGQ